MKKIVAVVGMSGSGKSFACDVLVSKGWKEVYFGGITFDKLKEEGLEINPTNEKMMREKIRQDFGMSAYAKILLPKIIESAKENDTVLNGLYSWDELKFLKEELKNDLTVIAVISDRKIRYERLSSRAIRPFTNEEALERDISEIENISKAGPIVFADYYIFNNGNKEEYIKRLEEILKEI